ncbi:hypothetical protein KCV06_g307, partial [Aureobasidium melanogenum]
MEQRNSLFPRCISRLDCFTCQYLERSYNNLCTLCVVRKSRCLQPPAGKCSVEDQLGSSSCDRRKRQRRNKTLALNRGGSGYVVNETLRLE